jgi:type IV pilus assembly protein PilY1
MDDSGSMDWNLAVTDTDDGGLSVSNEPISVRKASITSYTYLYDIVTNTYPPSSSFGKVLPTQEVVDADTDFNGNDYGVWRGRTAKYNNVYYNPEIAYEPWSGLDPRNDEFGPSDPTSARLDPMNPTLFVNLTSPVTFQSTDVPVWAKRGGTKSVDILNFYVPMYYDTAATPPLAYDDLHTKIEIKPGQGQLTGGLFRGGPNRIDCAGDGNPNDCTFEQELQNFANWFTYYRTREYVTKAGIGGVVAGVQNMRVGYDTISATTSEPVRPMNEEVGIGNKRLLMDNIYSVNSFGGTPLRQALARAGKTFACETGSSCPVLPAPDGQCQQNFTLLFSDGYWNGGSGTSFNTDIDADARPFDGGRYEDNIKQTLADVAMEYYEDDIQPTLDNLVPVGSRDLAGAPPGTFPDTDAVMHQHMKTYAIGFGINGTIDPATVPGNPVTPFGWTDPFAGSLEKIDDMVHAAINGRGEYYSAGNPLELRAAFEAAFLEFSESASSVSAATFSSTSLQDGTVLYRGFFDLRDNTGDLTATTVNPDGTLADTTLWHAADLLNVRNPTTRVIVTFDSLTGSGIPFRHASLNANQQAMLSAQELAYLRGDRSNQLPTGIYRERPAVRGILGDIVNSNPAFVGAPRAINRDQAPYPTNDLYSDFADAQKNRDGIVYVGANDGMMHAFDGITGEEVFAFVPNKIIDDTAQYRNEMVNLTSPAYFHQYYVDSSPRLNDIYSYPSASASAKSWMTVVMGGLGGGGKGYFALDVTDPNRFGNETSASNVVLWEFTEADDTYPVDTAGDPLGGAVNAWLDPQGNPVTELGYAVTQPTIVDDGSTLQNKEWAAIFGNGYNSSAGVATLFLLMMDRGLDGWDPGDFFKVTTGAGVLGGFGPLAGFPNALGTPAVVDRDLNGSADLVYAGDLHGNMWRFDISDTNPNNWKSVRLFTATYDDGGTDVAQPITAQPLVTKHPTESGFIVVFGTGSFVTKADGLNEEIQSIYGIWDRVDSSPATAASDTKALRLVEQVVTNVVEEVNGDAITRRIISRNAVNYGPDGGLGPGTYGWYIDFDMPRAATTENGNPNPDTSGNAPPAPQYPGERAIRRLILRNGVIVTTTVLPATGDASCFGALPGAIMLFDLIDGSDPDFAVIDFNNDGVIDNGDLLPVGGEDYAAGIVFGREDLDGTLVDLSTLGGEGDSDFLFVSGGDETISYGIIDINDSRTGRLSWRELDETN